MMRTAANWMSLQLTLALALASTVGGCGDVSGSVGHTDEVTGALNRDVPYCFGGCPQAQDGKKPGAVIFNGKAYFTFIRQDAKIGIVIESDLADDHFQNATTYALTDTSADGASLIVYKGVLHMVYLGMNHQYYMKRSTDGISWDGSWMLTNSGSTDDYAFLPGLNIWIDGGLRMFYPDGVCSGAGCGGFLMQSDVVSNYPSAPFIQNTFYLNEQTFLPVGTTTWNNQLYITWAGTSSNRPIYIKHFDASTGWSAPTIVQGNFGLPSLFPFSAGTLRLIYRGNNSNIYHADSSNGISFRTPVRFNDITNVTLAPFAISPAGRVWSFFIGTNLDLYTSDF